MTATAVTTPVDRALDWLADTDVEARVQLVDGMHRAIVLIPHPLAEDVMVRVVFTAATPRAALDGARGELRILAERAFANPAAGAAAANRAREAHLYLPAPKSMARVRRALIARGHAEPQHHEIQRAWLTLKINLGHDQHLVAAVVDQVIDGRQAMNLARGVHTAQAALL